MILSISFLGPRDITLIQAEKEILMSTFSKRNAAKLFLSLHTTLAKLSSYPISTPEKQQQSLYFFEEQNLQLYF